MPLSYRIYLCDSKDRILAREDVEAADDHAAMMIAVRLWDACSDVSSGFELWQGSRRLDTAIDTSTVNADWLNAEMQAAVAHHEERLRDSRWAIAGSKRLLEQTQRMAGKRT